MKTTRHARTAARLPPGTSTREARRSIPIIRIASPALHRALSLTLIAFSACARDDAGPERIDLDLLALSAEPLLEIGVLEGDDRYAFDRIVSVLRRPDGGVAVSDGGATEISLYDADGTFVRRWGRRGEGPGELQALSRIYAHAGDSLLAVDQWTGRVSVFDANGEFGRQMRAEELSGDSIFSLDVWLHRRFWVDGALAPDERRRVRAVLDALPPPRAAPGYRVVRVTRDGGLWIREPGPGEGGMRTWTVLDGSGRPSALVRVPDRFDPQHIERSQVLGRWRGASDVHFARAYGLEATGASSPVPAWLASATDDASDGPLLGGDAGDPRGDAGDPGGDAGDPRGDAAHPGGDAPASAGSAPAPSDEELMELFLGAIREMARAQEIHYAGNMTYTTRIDSLRWERPEEIEVDFVAADPRGWAGVFTHPSADRICGLGYGNASPPGWRPGAVLCAPAVGGDG